MLLGCTKTTKGQALSSEQREIGVILTAVLAVNVAFVTLGKGLWFISHEADMVHLVDIVQRMAEGANPHRDFVTPIGDWAMRPMAVLMGWGLPLGAALVWAQVLVAVLFFLPLLWVGISRLDRWQAAFFGVVVIGLTTGLVYGGTEPLLSLSMHYNRWAWAAALIVMALVLLPVRRIDRPVLDGVAIGALMVALAMSKVTFAVALAIPVVIALLCMGRFVVLAVSLGVALAGLAGVTLVYGFGFWLAYARDLLAVIGSENRAMPSDPMIALVLSPSGTPVLLAGLAVVLMLRRAGQGALAVSWLLFLPALIYVSWQNFGNDPLWLLFLVLFAWVLAQRADGAWRLGQGAVALVAAGLILPVAVNILWSPVRHLIQPEGAYRPMLSAGAQLNMVTARSEVAYARITVIEAPGSEPLIVEGQAMRACKLQSGLIGVLERDAAALARLAPEMSVQPFVADLFAPHWLFGDLEALPGGTPWYYDGLPGIEAASHLMVPQCAADPEARARIMALVAARGLGLEPLGETEDFRLFAIRR